MSSPDTRAYSNPYWSSTQRVHPSSMLVGALNNPIRGFFTGVPVAFTRSALSANVFTSSF